MEVHLSCLRKTHSQQLTLSRLSSLPRRWPSALLAVLSGEARPGAWGPSFGDKLYHKRGTGSEGAGETGI